MPIRLTLLLFLFLVGDICTAATILPVGPITFSSNTDYDNNFKEQGSYNLLSRDAAGYVTLPPSFPGTGLAIYDTSSIGGLNGLGGTGGSDANNDLSNFILSADFGGARIDGGFIVRLNNSEAMGYHTRITALSTTSVAFELWEGSSLSSAGLPIFTTSVNLIGLTIDANSMYPFKVTVKDAQFDFDFANGAAKASYTDPTLIATIGQVGIVLAGSSSSGSNLRMDNFQIQAIPEPSLIFAGVALGAVYITRRMKITPSNRGA